MSVTELAPPSTIQDAAEADSLVDPTTSPFLPTTSPRTQGITKTTEHL
jgi:hypothetical protein